MSVSNSHSVTLEVFEVSLIVSTWAFPKGQRRGCSAAALLLLARALHAAHQATADGEDQPFNRAPSSPGVVILMPFCSRCGETESNDAEQELLSAFHVGRQVWGCRSR